MQRHLNMENIYASSVNIIPKHLDSLSLSNPVTPKDFFKIPLHNIDRSYATSYNSCFELIQNDRIEYNSFERVIELLKESKNLITQITLPSLYNNLIALLYKQIQSPSLETHTSLDTHLTRI